MKYETGFKNYSIGFGIYFLIYMLSSAVLGFILGLFLIEVSESMLTWAVLIISLIAIYGVAKWRKLSFWKFFGFVFLANIVVMVLLFVLGILLLEMMGG
jgi:hypothetical protein